MKRENRVHILLRYLLVSILILLLAGGICYKLFSTTVIDAHHWNALASKQLEKVDTIAPERGDILSDKGYILATKVFKIDVLNSLGAICGGMTSTPALGTLMAVTKAEAVAVSYAATYPLALIMVVLCCEFIPILF